MILVVLNAHSDGTYIRYDPRKYGYGREGRNLCAIPKIIAGHGGSPGFAKFQIDPYKCGLSADIFFINGPQNAPKGSNRHGVILSVRVSKKTHGSASGADPEHGV